MPAVILAVDGTLIDSSGAHARAWVDAFAAHGITVAYEPVRRRIGMGGDKLMPAVSNIAEDSELGQFREGKRAVEVYADSADLLRGYESSIPARMRGTHAKA